MKAQGEKRGARILASSVALVASAIALSPARPARSDASPVGDLATILAFKAPPTAQTGDPGAPRKAAAGQPNILAGNAAFSAAVLSTFGAPSSQGEVALLADWDGREDLTADRAKKVAGLAGTLTRAAVSEHTIANGFLENVFYWGDSVGNVYVGIDNTGDGFADITRTINVPTVLNAFGTLNSDDQIVISGLAVCPVADLQSFPNVNGAYTSFVGQVGEILYVTFEDPNGGLRLASNNEVVHSGLLAFPVADVVSPATSAPGVITTAGDPITMGASFGVAFSAFHNLAGVAVDDDGSVYFQQVDLDQGVAGNIVKITDTGTFQDRSTATNGFLTITNLNPVGGNYGNASGPAPQVNKFTNFSGTSPTFGNIAAIAAGPGNRLYAAVARSLVATDDLATQATEGLFSNPAALGPTPSMVISFSDCSGAFDTASASGMIPGVIPVGDGFADVATNGLTLVAGVNNFIVYALGTGPDIRAVASPIRATPTNTLKLSFQVDFTVYGGITVDEESRLYVISGGTPAGLGRDPSPTLGEILCFTDSCPADRRADYVDFRGDGLPNPPASGGNSGDGDSDRFDHIFATAPVEGLVPTPTGIAGLARGFLRYTNRLAPTALGVGITLGQTAGTPVLGDDDTTLAAIFFETLDPSHQVAGGDDQTTPFRGDDDDGAGSPANPGPLNGGFEFAFGGPGIPTCVWNGFFWNSNGSVTFGAGDTDNTPTEGELRSGPPRIAGAWADLNPNARASTTAQFPLLAVGFAHVNDFVVRWINVPVFGGESAGSRNSLTIHLFDDGVGIDENANQALNPGNPIGNNAVPFDLNEGPTDLRFARDPVTAVITSANPRPEGSGFFALEYGRMDILGTAVQPVLVGYSIGGQPVTNPPGLCESDVGDAARAADGDSFLPCAIGLGMEPTVHEFFDQGVVATPTTPAVPDFDLRSEGNDFTSCTPVGQPDGNREVVQFAGVGCQPLASPVCTSVSIVQPVIVGPHQPAGTLVDALCTAQVDVYGRGFFANTATTICAGAGPSQRPGATVTTSLILAVDTDGDTIADYLGPLTNVTVFSDDRVRGSLSPVPALPGSPFPLGFCGGNAEIRLATTATAGDNNVFGAFSRNSTCIFATGTRAPIVLTATPSTGAAAVAHPLSLVGDCFVLPGPVNNVTGVSAVQTDRSAHVVQATTFSIVDATHVNATFQFAATDAGKTFAIHVEGPNGLSRNLRKLRPGEDPTCPLGNEAGDLVTFTVTP